MRLTIRRIMGALAIVASLLKAKILRRGGENDQRLAAYHALQKAIEPKVYHHGTSRHAVPSRCRTGDSGRFIGSLNQTELRFNLGPDLEWKKLVVVVSFELKDDVADKKKSNRPASNTGERHRSTWASGGGAAAAWK